jgi:hypothetical protein
MKNLTKKIVLAFISLSLITSAANAGALNVTGSAKATYSIMSSGSTTGANDEGKGLGIANEFTLSASGELDNGWTWSYAQDIDDATVQDDASLVFGLGDMGTVGIFVSEGSLSQKYGFDASAYGVGSDTGYGGGTATTTVMQYGKNISSYNNVQYHLPAGLLPLGISAKVAVAPNAVVSQNASSNARGAENGGAGDQANEYQITAAPIDGLTIGASYFQLDGEAGTKQGYQSGSIVAKYAFGPVTVGYGQTKIAPNLGAQTASEAGTDYTQAYHNNAYSVGFAANDNLSLSYTVEKSKADIKNKSIKGNTTTNSDVEMTIDTIQAAYTMGGMTLSASMKDVDNQSYTANEKVSEYLFAVALAF